MTVAIRIGTRGSRLALAQANEVKQRLSIAANIELEAIEIVPIKTSGDMILDRNLAEIGGKGLFTKEIEEALLNNQIDLAVHSMKDMPASLPDGLVIAAMLPREDPRDALISYQYNSINSLDEKAIVGTSSSRRKSQLLNIRPDLEIINFRGNIDTRITKLQDNMASATLLAVGGLKRLNFSENQYHIIEIDEMLPAVAQGAVGIEINQKNTKIEQLVAKINCFDTTICVNAEREFLKSLNASCATPIAALAKLNHQDIEFRALIASRDGKIIEKCNYSGQVSDAIKFGAEAAKELLSRVKSDFFAYHEY